MCQSVGGELRQLAHLLVASLKAAGMRCETLRLPGPFSPTASISESCWVLFSALDTSCHSSSRMAWGHRAYPPGACAYKCVDNDPLTALISNGWGETAHVEQWCTFGLCAQRRACVCVRAKPPSTRLQTQTHLQVLPVLRKADHGHRPEGGRHRVCLGGPKERQQQVWSQLVTQTGPASAKRSMESTFLLYLHTPAGAELTRY